MFFRYRRLLQCVLLVVLGCQAGFAVRADGMTPALGDLTWDGVVTSADMVAFEAALKHPQVYMSILPWLTADDLLAVGDLDGNGRLGRADLAGLQRVVGIERGSLGRGVLLPGDLSGDSSIGLEDVLLLHAALEDPAAFVAQNNGLSHDEVLLLADLNGDDTVSSKDLAVLKSWVARVLPDESPSRPAPTALEGETSDGGEASSAGASGSASGVSGGSGLMSASGDGGSGASGSGSSSGSASGTGPGASEPSADQQSESDLIEQTSSDESGTPGDSDEPISPGGDISNDDVIDHANDSSGTDGDGSVVGVTSDGGVSDSTGSSGNTGTSGNAFGTGTSQDTGSDGGFKGLGSGGGQDPILSPEDIGLPPGPNGVDAPGLTEALRLDYTPNKRLPVLAAWATQVRAGETLSATGAGLAGAEFGYWTPGFQATSLPLRTAEDRCQYVVPHKAPQGVGLIWPETPAGVGRPVRINAPEAWWARVQLSEDRQRHQIRLFGVGLMVSKNEVLVVYDSVAGSGMPLRLLAGDDYSLTVEAPRLLPEGQYQIHVHNGTGGRYGWSRPTIFRVDTTTEFGEALVDVDAAFPDETSDARRINRAVAKCQKEGGGVVRLTERVYRLDDTVVIPEGPAVLIKGAGAGAWSAKTEEVINGTVLLDQRHSNERRHLVALLGQEAGLERLSVVSDRRNLNQIMLGPVRLAGKKQTINHVRIVGFGVRSALHIEETVAEGGCITGSEIHFDRMGIVSNGADRLKIAGNVFRGYYDSGRGTNADAIRLHAGNEIIVEENRAASHDRPNGQIVGRLLVMYDNRMADSYIANNWIDDFGTTSNVTGADRNASEAILFHYIHEDSDVYQVRASEGRDTDLGAWSPGDRINDSGWIAYVIAGSGAGQWRDIHLTKSGFEALRDWEVDLDRSSWVLIQQAFRRHLVVGNHIDGAPRDLHHKAMGVYLYHNCFGNVVSGNTIRNVSMGISVAGGVTTPSAWNLVRDNEVSGISGYAAGAGPYAMALNEQIRTVNSGLAAFTFWSNLGNAFRGNWGDSVSVVGGFGWRHLKEWPDSHYNPGLNRGVAMTVVEGSRFSRFGEGVRVGPPMVWMVSRANRHTEGNQHLPTVKDEEYGVVGLYLEQQLLNVAFD